MSERNKYVAQTIVSQLGGSGRLKVMIGAKNFTCYQTEEGNPYLSFRFGACRKWNTVRIELTPSDLYRVTFYRIGKAVKESDPIDNIYAEQLKDVIENETGLYLSL